ncbi:hypothetical protein EV191_103313 [Tamaricihabitans halophyticus]|uniref:Uncharacterized protein n=1 Tax=Tamaricihabitans halophyticus TaxID=1262583 RepID=A0A4R2QYI8_9PSEU|nr:hypothetical protein [Tamaricihabitans halophyticus]TCP54269.1 hypothetical protein EV191_103313 [Tamaricihabitans halophyticus]
MKVLRVVLLIAGLGLLVGGVVEAASVSGDDTRWICEEPPEPNGTLMRCATSGSPGLVDGAGPVTLSLLGLGLLVVFAALGQYPRRQPATPYGQPAPQPFYQQHEQPAGQPPAGMPQPQQHWGQPGPSA